MPGTFGLHRAGTDRLSSCQICFQTPAQQTKLPTTASSSSQHPVNTVHLGYLLFERCHKQWHASVINMWAHDRFRLHNCWICPASLSRVTPKCTLTQNKPLLVTKGAALGGHGLCPISRWVEQNRVRRTGGLRAGGGVVGEEGDWLHSSLSLLLSRNGEQDQII